MTISDGQSSIFFKALPAGLAELSEDLFPESLSSVAILPLATIDQLTGQDLSLWLHKKEREQLTALTHIKRNREWLGGRICAKEALHIFFRKQKEMEEPPPYPQCRITNEESGRPCFTEFTGNNFLLPELSITHSKEFAAALISPVHCGIDIQYSSEKLLRVKERFCIDGEEQLLQHTVPQLSILSQLTLLWTGKEAVKKMLSPGGIPGFHELILQQLIPQDENNALLLFSRTNSPETLLPVAAGILDNDYCLALCCRHDTTSN
ncbi:MAG: 4'-phosphopantetheinyl transferase superfamily protein [Desulfocapsa sp.]|nr:4'-phosphopantetheinyl transferase superfamily protein [Desulfocapsa sp.]